ncbi:uncharacterized protein ACHE_80562S [Aspergillus chevalieri]|uniref:Uncharacterized protein n=1 Tax=Aspergillus chevalieri TaxID=182096 RepID=A0A7R7ZTA3_ASPCH|nr:uncharacterized protein ACHE_80562S [Aspergillus chevalieri]BCR92661.1 hypothetical protein ACHE_80562S [Aspergillus chevalieri]
MSGHEDMLVRKKSRTFGLTVEEIEKSGETSLIQNHKLDTCAHWFTSRLYSLKPDYFPGCDGELEQHVRRLVPGSLKDNDAVLQKKELKDLLSARWKSTLHGLRSGANKED